MNKEKLRKHLIAEQLVEIHSIIKTKDNDLLVDWYVKPNWYKNQEFGQLLLRPEINEKGELLFNVLDDEMMPKIYKEYIYSKLIEIILKNITDIIYVCDVFYCIKTV